MNVSYPRKVKMKSIFWTRIPQGSHRVSRYYNHLKFDESEIMTDPSTKFGKEILHLSQPGFCYSLEHVNLVAESIISNYQNYENRDRENGKAFVADTFSQEEDSTDPPSLNELGDALTAFKNTERKFLCAVVSLNKNGWFTLLFLKIDAKLMCLYFDPLGKEIIAALQSTIGVYVHDLEFATHFNRYNCELNCYQVSDTGPICLRYFEMVLSELQTSSPDFKSLLSKSRFELLAEMNLLPYQCHEELIATKIRFQAQCYQQQVLFNFTKRALEVAPDEFLTSKEAWENYLFRFKNLLNINPCVVQYLKELHKQENSNDQNTEVARENCVLKNNTFLDEIIQQGEYYMKDLQKRQLEPITFHDKDFITLKLTYPHLSIFVEGFTVLSDALKNTNCKDKIIQEVIQTLNLDKDFFEKLFSSSDIKMNEADQMDLKEIEDLKAFLYSFKLFPLKIQSMTNISQDETIAQPFLKFLKKFFERNENCKGFSYDVLPTMNQMKKLYQTFIQIRHVKWRDADLNSISKWAAGVKENVNKSSLKPKIPEILAVIDRASEILTSRRLRPWQVLTLLLTATSGVKYGKIWRLPPEEVPIDVIQILATMKILQGERSVDVVMSNTESVDEAIEKHKEFYEIFLIKVASPSNSNNSMRNFKVEQNHIELRKCYLADVVYGTLETFKEDYLLDIFGQRRGNRQFDFLIVDEIGPPLIENAFSMTTLAKHIPSVEKILEVYELIWQGLSYVDNKYLPGFIKELGRNLSEKQWQWLEKLSEHKIPDMSHVYADSVSVLNNGFYDFYAIVKDHVLPLMNVIEIPTNLKEFVEGCREIWILSAMMAKYKLKENYDYYLAPGRVVEVTVIPKFGEHNEETSEIKTDWSNWIHIFLRLKHNLKVTMENLAVCGISNYGFISLYNSGIIGLTFTLGSSAEQELLHKMYNVTSGRIPASEDTLNGILKFMEHYHQIVNDKHWDKFMAIEANSVAVQEGRAVLIVCKTIEDCHRVEYCLKIVDKIVVPPNPRSLFEKHDTKFRTIRTFTQNYHADISPKILYPGDVIIATWDIARTLDVKASAEVDSKGGLHVCVGFLPPTVREKNVLYQHAQRGNMGSAKSIIRDSELERKITHLNQMRDNFFVSFSNNNQNSPHTCKEEIHSQSSNSDPDSEDDFDCNLAEVWPLDTSHENDCPSPQLQNSQLTEQSEFPAVENIPLITNDLSHSMNEKLVEHVNETKINEFSVDANPVGCSNSSKFDKKLAGHLDEYLFPCLLEHWGYNPETATKQEKNECISKNFLAKMTHETKRNVSYFDELTDRFDRSKKSIEFLAGTSEKDHLKYDDTLIKNDTMHLKNIEEHVHKFYTQDQIFQQFWKFSRQHHLDGEIKISQYVMKFSKDYLDTKWAIWLFTKNWEGYFDFRNFIDSWQNKLKIFSGKIFSEFRALIAEAYLAEEEANEEDSLNQRANTDEDLFSACQTHQSGSANSAILESSLLITHQMARSNMAISQPPILKPFFKFNDEKVFIEEFIQKTMLTEIQQLGIDCLQYIRSHGEESTDFSSGQNQIAAGVLSFLQINATAIRNALSKTFQVCVTLIIKGIMEITQALLDTQNNAAINEEKSVGSKIDRIIFIVNLLSSSTFQINVQNLKMIEEASNDCLNFAKLMMNHCLGFQFHVFLQRLGVQLKRILAAVTKSVRSCKEEESSLGSGLLPADSLFFGSFEEESCKSFGFYILYQKRPSSPTSRYTNDDYFNITLDEPRPRESLKELRDHCARLMFASRILTKCNQFYSIIRNGSVGIEEAAILCQDLEHVLEVKCLETGQLKSVGMDIHGNGKVELETMAGHIRPRCGSTFIVDSDQFKDADLGESAEILGHISEKTGSKKTSWDLWNHMIDFITRTIDSDFQWQSETQEHQEHSRFQSLIPARHDGLSWSDLGQLDEACKLIIDGSEGKPGDLQELNSILKIKKESEFEGGHAISKHSSPQKGLQFMKKNQNRKSLTTFESYHEQVKALQAGLKVIADKLDAFPQSRGMDFEVHMDALKLDLRTPFMMYEIRRDEKGKPPVLQDMPCVVKFITIVLGYRVEPYRSGARKLFHIHTIFPREKAPNGLSGNERCSIRIRTQAQEAYAKIDSPRWHKKEQEFNTWLEKPFQ